MPKRTLTAFVSVSFKDEDKQIANWFCDVIKSFNIEPILANTPEPRPHQDKIRDMIGSSDAFIGIFLKRDKVEGKELWKPPIWCHEELGIAFERQKPLIIFVEKDVEIEVLMKLEADYEIFDRDELLESVPRFNQYLMALRELIRMIPENTYNFQTYYAIMTDLYNALNHFLSSQNDDEYLSWTRSYLNLTGKFYGLEKSVHKKVIKAYNDIVRLNRLRSEYSNGFKNHDYTDDKEIITGISFDIETLKIKISEEKFIKETFDVIASIVDAILALNEEIPDSNFKINENKIEGLLVLKDWPKLIKTLEEGLKKLTPEQLEEFSRNAKKNK